MADKRDAAAAALAALPALFYVKHRNDEVVLLNAKCPTALLSDRLRKLGDLPPDVGVDLIAVSSAPAAGATAGERAAGERSGAGGGGGDHGKNQQPLGLLDRIEANGQAIYANTYVASRATYALLAASDDEDGVRVLKPLWRSAFHCFARLCSAAHLQRSASLF